MKRFLFDFLICFVLFSGVASAENLIGNGDFETGDKTGWSGYHTVNVSAGYNSNYGLYMDLPFTEMFDSKFHEIYHTSAINFTDINNFTFNLNIFECGLDSGIWVRLDGKYGSTLYSKLETTTDGYEYIDVNISSISGIHTLYFIGWANANPNPGYLQAYVDNINLPGIPYSPLAPQITTIQTIITKDSFPLTGIVINDINSTGGFPSESGSVILTPTNNTDKIYPITLNGNDLIDGFELQVSATGSEVTATPITVNDLGVDRTYNIYLDGQFVEKIGEVTTYQYNITSFSTHTLKVEYDITDADDDAGGGSGPITDDIIEIGDITLTEDEFDLLTIEQIEAFNVSQETKDKLIAMKSINVDWWRVILGLCLMATITEGSRKEGNNVILVIAITGVIISAFKLGYI